MYFKKNSEKISNNTFYFFQYLIQFTLKKKNLFNLENLMNKFPDIKNLLNELDKTKYF